MNKFLFPFFSICLTAILAVGACDSDSGQSRNDDTNDTDSQNTDSSQCPMNSGWPCNCGMTTTCQDGSRCISLNGMGSNSGAFCSGECDDEGVCPETLWDATGSCSVMGGSCLLTCTADNQCPPHQTCQSNGQSSICYPEPAAGGDADTDADTDTDVDIDGGDPDASTGDDGGNVGGDI